MYYLLSPSILTMAPRWDPPRRTKYPLALLVDLLLVESLPPRYFALLAGSRLVDVPLGDTHGQTEGLLIVVLVVLVASRVIAKG